MNYETLFKAARDKTVRSVITGAGEFGASFIFQSQRVPGLEVTAICNRTTERGLKAFMKAGIEKDRIKICESEAEVKNAFDRKQFIVVNDLALLTELPIDVVVEGTGNPEAGARNADIAIRSGMHIAMVSKEADSVVGPILFHKAQRAGVVYTAVEGDQPSLLIGLITWARVLGLKIICAGKSSEYDFVIDPETCTVTSFGKTVSVPDFASFWRAEKMSAEELVRQRSLELSGLPQRAVPDLCEMGIVANATGIGPSTATFHAPIIKPVELPEVLTTQKMGGILAEPGVIDVLNCLRRPDEASLAGGVFIVVECEDRSTWTVLKEKGHLVNRSGRCAAIYRPAHLLGIEAAISVLAAALLGHATGAEELKHEYDLVGRASADLAAGTHMVARGHHHTIEGIEALLVKSIDAYAGKLVPYYLLDNSHLRGRVTALKPLTREKVDLCDSVLVRLRAEQDLYFEKGR